MSTIARPGEIFQQHWRSDHAFGDDEPVPELNDKGKVKGDVPGEVPDSWTETDLEDAARTYQTSIRNRSAEASKFRGGLDQGHRERLRREKEFLKKIESKLREVQGSDEPDSKLL